MQIFYQHHENTMRMSLHGKRLYYTPHFHPSLELVYVRQGSTTALIDKQEYRLIADDLFVVFPHQIHGYRDDSKDLDRVLMFIPLEYCPAFKEKICAALPEHPILHCASHIPHLVDLFAPIHAARYTKLPHSEQILGGYLTAFIGLLLAQLSLAPINEMEWSSMHSILRYCALHYREPMSTARLADALHLNRNYVSSVFSQRLHITFNNYLNSLRIEDARRLLHNTDDTITDIAATVGFETIRTFNRAFLRICGMTPSAFREQKKGE